MSVVAYAIVYTHPEHGPNFVGCYHTDSVSAHNHLDLLVKQGVLTDVRVESA